MESDVSNDKSVTEECYICGFVCSSRRMLGHIRSHTHVEIFECEICGDRFASKKTLQKHYITHKTHFICEHCNKKFVDPERLRSHICFNPEENYTCETCGKEFVHQSRWMKHIATHSKDKAFKCQYCSKGFRYKRNLTAHIAKHPVDEDGNIKIESTEQKIFTCDVCKKEFPNKRNLERHHLSHTDEKPFICQVCNRGFTLKHNMEVHERLHYLNERPHQCQKCGKCFSRRSNLKVHCAMHLRHELGLPAPKQNNGKVFPCDICQKSFISKRNLIQHQVTHTKEKPYVCQFCNQRFSYDSCLKRHSYLHTEGAFRRRPKYSKNRIVVIGPDGEIDTKPFICHVCHAAFNEEIELKAHRKSFWQVHNYKCCKCLQVYKCKKKLKEHEKIHDIGSTSKPVVCALKVDGSKSTESESDTIDTETECGESSMNSVSSLRNETKNIEYESDIVDIEEEESFLSLVVCAPSLENKNIESEKDSKGVEIEDEATSFTSRVKTRALLCSKPITCE